MTLRLRFRGYLRVTPCASKSVLLAAVWFVAMLAGLVGSGVHEQPFAVVAVPGTVNASVTQFVCVA